MANLDECYGDGGGDGYGDGDGKWRRLGLLWMTKMEVSAMFCAYSGFVPFIEVGWVDQMEP